MKIIYMNYSIQIEKPFRALQQLRAMLISLARIHHRDMPTEHEKELLRRIVLGSGPNDRVKALALFRNPEVAKNGKLTVSACAEGINKAYNRAKAILEELQALEVLKRYDFDDGDPAKGKDKHHWKPVPEFFDIITKPYVELDHIADLMIAIAQNSHPGIPKIGLI